MASYYVIGADGQMYGPADEATLAGWAQQGRLTAQSTLQDAATNQRIYASQVPAIASSFSPAPTPTPAYQQPAYQQPAYQQPAAYQQQQTAIPMTGAYGYQQPSAYQQPGYQQPMAYQQPQAPIGYANPYAMQQVPTHAMTSFSPVAMIFLHWLTFGLFSLIYHHMKHDRMPTVRHDDPSAGKAIGFMFIPIFGPFYWNFFANLRLCDRINEQRRLAGLAPTAPRGLALAFAICMCIPYVNLLIGIPIVGAIYSTVLQANVNELVRATRGPNA